MFPTTLETDSLELQPLTPDAVDVHELYTLLRAGREGTGPSSSTSHRGRSTRRRTPMAG